MFTIAGATGHVGAAVAAKLLQNGAKMRVIVRSKEKGARFAEGGAEVTIGNLEDVQFLAEALRGAEGAFLLLPRPVPPPPTAADIRASARKMAAGYAQAVRASNIPHVVFVSAQGAQYGEGMGVIGTLHDVEVDLATTGTVLTILRCAEMMDNWEPLLPTMRDRGVLPNFHPEDRARAFIASWDVGEEAAKALLARPQASRIIELAGPADYAPRHVAEIFSRKLGKSVELATVKTGFAEALKATGMPTSVAELAAESREAVNAGTVRFEHPGSVIRTGTTLEQFAAAIVARN
jgi:uncharacterized protein YbjT (DUF2867 family)